MPNRANQPDTSRQNTAAAHEISAELVKEVTDKVYLLMLKDLKIARERLRTAARPVKGRLK